MRRFHFLTLSTLPRHDDELSGEYGRGHLRAMPACLHLALSNSCACAVKKGSYHYVTKRQTRATLQIERVILNPQTVASNLACADSQQIEFRISNTEMEHVDHVCTFEGAHVPERAIMVETCEGSTLQVRTRVRKFTTL